MPKKCPLYYLRPFLHAFRCFSKLAKNEYRISFFVYIFCFKHLIKDREKAYLPSSPKKKEPYEYN